MLNNRRKMPSFNRVIFLGHLTADPVGKVVSDNPLAQFTVACNRRGKKKDGTINEETCFLDVEAWGAQAEIASKYLKKGDSALIEGRLRQARWQAKDGTDRTKIILVCESIILTEPKTATTADTPPPPPAPRQAQGPMAAQIRNIVPPRDTSVRDTRPVATRAAEVKVTEDLDDLPF